MRRIVSLAAGMYLAVSCMAAANAAPTAPPATPRGIENSKKVMKRTMERSKKMQEVRKRGQARRAQALSGK